MARLPALLLTVTLAAGCASRHGGGARYGHVTESSVGTVERGDSPLRLLTSVQVDRELCSDYFLALNLTFENRSGEWIDIRHVELDFGSDKLNRLVRIPYGEQLRWWASSTFHDIAINAHNRQIALEVLHGVGAALATGSRDPGVQMMGAVMADAAVKTEAHVRLNEKLSSLDRPGVLPETHLLTGPFMVPPGLATKRWLVLQMRSKKHLRRLKGFYLTYRTADGQTERVALKLSGFHRRGGGDGLPSTYPTRSR